MSHPFCLSCGCIKPVLQMDYCPSCIAELVTELATLRPKVATLETKLTRRDAAFAALVQCVRATDQFSESLNSCLSCRANLAINQTLCNFHGGRQHWVTEQRREALKLAEGVEG